MYKKGKGLAGSTPEYSYLNTFNPVSAITGGGDRVPEWAMNLTPGNPTAGYMAAKAGAVALLAAGLVGGYRAVKHFNRMSDMAEKNNPAKQLETQLGTTFNTTMKSKTASGGRVVPKPNVFSVPTAVSVAVPLGAMLLAAAGSYKAVDSWADGRRNKKLDASMEAKSNAIKELMLARAKIPRGRLDDKSYNAAITAANSADAYSKEARRDDMPTAAFRGVVAGAGLLGIAIFGASAVGAHSYFKKTDEENLKYKAAKKGLREYAKLKTSMTPVTTIPTDAKKYFEEIDGEEVRATPPKALPALQDVDLNRPISVTL